MSNLKGPRSRESAQQQLIEDIVRTMHTATEDDEQHVKTFHRLALATLDALQYPEPRKAGLSNNFEQFVWKPIELFTDDPAERRYLLLQAFDKILGPVRTSINYRYTHRELTKIAEPGLRVVGGTSANGEGSEFPVT